MTARHPRRTTYRIIAYGCVGLGAMGVVLPLLPTTPFLLLAAWAAPKGAPALDLWLRRHPRFGPVLQAWRDQRAIPARAKWLACLLLLISWLILLWTAVHPLVPPLTALLFVLVGLFVTTRPLPRGPAAWQ
jgi:uncharacterized protein